MTRDVVVYGTGGVGRQAVQIIDDLNADGAAWSLVGYLDDDPARAGTELHGVPIVGAGEWLTAHAHVDVVIAIGSPKTRWHVARRVRALGHTRFATLVHPSASIGARCQIGAATIIYPGVLIDTDVTLGEFVLVNKACTLGHDAQIGAYTTLSPGVNLGGAAHIGAGCDLGINSCTVQGVVVGAWSVIGAGAVVLGELPSNVTAVGVPAKVIKQRQPGWHSAALASPDNSAAQCKEVGRGTA
ncbi:MAG: acetyltransferase [Anaerolineales bacterium]|nr:acetyltransferase [Anaerolineales bacterium]